MPSISTAPIVGIGEVLWDLLPSGPRLGGATTNFSILCARLGNAAALVSRLGQDRYGELALARLHEITAGSRFDLSYLQTPATPTSVRETPAPTGTVSVTLDAEGRPHYTIDAPVAWDEITLTRPLLELAGRAAVVCFGTLAQRRVESRESLRAFVEATAPECIRVCDMNLRMPFCTAEIAAWGLQHATVLKVSDEELPQLTQFLTEAGLLQAPLPAAPDSADAITAWATTAAHTLLAAAPHCRLVAITLGPHGSLLADRSATDRHLGFPVKVADTIGAGDAFTAGLVHALLNDAQHNLAHISTVANLCGSYVAGQQGATPELPPELLATIQNTLA